MVALFAARNAGIQVPDEAFEKGKAFLLSCQDNNGGFGYQTNSGANLPRTAIGSLVLSLAGETKSEAYEKSVDYLRQNAKFGDRGHKFYSLYYTSQAMFRVSPGDWNLEPENVSVCKPQLENGSEWELREPFCHLLRFARRLNYRQYTKDEEVFLPSPLGPRLPRKVNPGISDHRIKRV